VVVVCCRVELVKDLSEAGLESFMVGVNGLLCCWMLSSCVWEQGKPITEGLEDFYHVPLAVFFGKHIDAMKAPN